MNMSFDKDNLTSGQRIFLEKYANECIVAGGAIRDLVLGKEIRDYDFYTRYGKDVERELKMLGFLEVTSTSKSYINEDIKKVYRLYDFDVILTLTSPLEIVESFCVNISKIYALVDKDLNILSIHKLKDFSDFEITGEVEVYLDKIISLNFIPYLEKIKVKYPNYLFKLIFYKENDNYV